MSKILLCTDNHFCSTSSILRQRGAQYTLRLENQLQTINWIVDKAIELECSNIFFLGDFFDSATLNAEEISCLSEIDFKGIYTHFLVGNHEMGNATLDYSSAHSFLLNQNCEVYNKPSVLVLDNTSIYMLPYQLEVNRLDSVMEYFPTNLPTNTQYRLLLSHNDIAGINMGKFVSQVGFDVSDLSSKFDLVVNGHIHNQGWVANNVLNLGNITGQNFSEDSVKYPHQAMLIDTETLEYTFFTNPYALNFAKLDFTTEETAHIDYINKVSHMIGNNAVLSIKVKPDDYEYLRNRFDPQYNTSELIPKSCNVLCCRVIIDKGTSQVNEEDNSKVSTLHLDHLNEFQKYVLENIGEDEVTLQELQEVLK